MSEEIAETKTGRGNRLIPDFEPAFPSLSKDAAGELESLVKADYRISEYSDPHNPTGYPGWAVDDLQTGKKIIYSPNARYVTTKEYIRKDVNNNPTENVLDLVARIAVNIATAERKYNSDADVLGTAKKFARRMIHREFAPNTPTFANAGGHLQQLAACFGMIPEDYLGTDDIGEDPEKQGNGIFDILRYGGMIQKSGGGTGYNFSYTRPKNSSIATTSGRASGPMSWLKAYNAATQEINQGGFRRGANMGVLEYWHPDIFEFLSAKLNHKISFFNLSMGVDERFMDAVESDSYFLLSTPQDMTIVPLEDRVWTAERLMKKSEFEKLDKTRQEDIDPSLLLSDDGKKVIVRYTGKEVGFVDSQSRVQINARATLEYAAEMAHRTGCPGIIFFDTMNRDNPTPNAGNIKVVNPCGEQPLLNFEACNLGSINCYSCIETVDKSEGFTSPGLSKDGRYYYGKVIDGKIQRKFNLGFFGEIIDDGIHFLDNVIDMGKYPFKKVYSHVKANRKVGLGVMGISECAMVLGINYESEDMEGFSRFISAYMTERAMKKSQALAEERGVFPNWYGSIYDPESPHAAIGKTGKIRHATRITIAPNGTTGRYADVTGGIEPMFSNYFVKNLANGKKLEFVNEIFEEELKIRGIYSPELIAKVREKGGSIQGIEEIPEDMRVRYKLAIEVDPLWHVRIQGAFQNGERGFGVENAVSKTVNLPESATPEDFFRIFMEARKRGCKGVTAYKDGTIEGQPLTTGKVEGNGQLEQIVRVHVLIESSAISMADNATKYRIVRRNRDNSEDVFHVVFTDELRREPKTGRIYMFPREDFQQTAPLGDEIAVEFASAGLDRTSILKEPNPDYIKLVERWKSVTGNRSGGMGPGRINSPTHAVGLVFEHALLSRGIVKYDETTGELVHVVRKADTVQLTEEEKAKLLDFDGEAEQKVTTKKISGFLCECGSTEYIFEQGCHEPKCRKCGWSKTGGCS